MLNTPKHDRTGFSFDETLCLFTQSSKGMQVECGNKMTGITVAKPQE